MKFCVLSHIGDLLTQEALHPDAGGKWSCLEMAWGVV